MNRAQIITELSELLTRVPDSDFTIRQRDTLEGRSVIRIIQCPSGETCWADECIDAGQCMHMDEAPPVQPAEPKAAQAKPRIIAQGEPDKAAAVSLLLGLGLWDLMESDEREAFCERGEVWDTVPGREIYELVKASKGLA